ncbi:hypothetical protein [Vreelandella olivaria]|uniref:hypothetical protein n=1 Tax=Vreelandella olivaria TaxID=390919 RepID=UPI00201F81B7|nr:hypothetical protein [Halomonas olivaria]
MSNDKSSSVLNQRRSRRQVLAAMGLGAAALYVAPTLVSMGQAEARGHRSSRPSYSRPSYSRPSYSRHHRSNLQRHDKYYSRPYRSRYVRSGRSRWERDGVIEIRLSRVLPRW